MNSVQDPAAKPTTQRGSEEKALLELLPLLRPGGLSNLSVQRRRELGERIEQDPRLAVAFARWQGLWDGLDLPSASAAPLGFAPRVAAQVRRRSEGELNWSRAPRWARLAAAAALLVGTLGGVSLGLWQSEMGELGELVSQGSLADDYWLMLEEEGADGGTDGGEAPR